MKRVAWLLALALLASPAAAQQVNGGGGGGTGGAGMLPSGLNSTTAAIVNLFRYGTVPTPIAGSTMAVNNLLENGSLLLKNEGALWSTQAYTWLGISKTMTATTVPVPGATGPLSSLFVYAVENGSGAPVAPIVGDCNVVTTNGYCAGANLIARSNGGGINAKLVGLEIDVEPASGDTSLTTGGGLFVNAVAGSLNQATNVPAIQVGTVNGGTFANGIMLNGIASTGTGIGMMSGSGTVASLLNTTNGTYGTNAIVVANTHKVQFSGASGSPALMYVDSSNYTRIVPASGPALLFRNNADSVSLASLDTSGNFVIGFGDLYDGAAAPTGTAGSGYVRATSPTLAGTPLAPTAAPGTNTTQLATTAFVQAGLASGSGAIDHVSYQPGLLTAVNATKAAFHKFSKATTVDNIEGSAATFSCIANPTVTVFECGTSATCASSPVTIGTVTITAAGTVVDGSISSAAITAGDYVAFAMTAGTCASVDLAVTVQTHVN